MRDVTNFGIPNNRIISPHDLFKFATADENTFDFPFDGGEGVAPVQNWPVLSIKGQSAGCPGCRPPLPRGNFMMAAVDTTNCFDVTWGLAH